MEITYIYELSKNGIPFYIGKSKRIKNREKEHKKTYGNNITLIIIDSVKSFKKEDWKPLETFWVTQYKAWGFNLLNKNEGGNGRPATLTECDKKKYQEKYHQENLNYRKKYYLDNKEKLDNLSKQYQLEHSEERKEYRKQYYIENKEKIKKQNIKNDIKYRETEKNKLYRKEYYKKNKDKLNQQSKNNYLKRNA